jgi:hypothetical protein
MPGAPCPQDSAHGSPRRAGNGYWEGPLFDVYSGLIATFEVTADCFGCVDLGAWNYDSQALGDDGTCLFP